MRNEPLDKWQSIVEAARHLGASEVAIAKWRQRGVPYRWRLTIIEWSNGSIRSDDFVQAEGRAA